MMDGYAMLMTIASALSMAGDLYIIVTYLIVQNVRDRMYMKLVYAIALADLCGSASTIMGPQIQGTIKCGVQAVVSSISNLTTIFLTVILTRLLVNIVAEGKAFPVNFISLPSLALCVSVIVLTLLPLSTDEYGPLGEQRGWCFISSGQRSRGYSTLAWVISSFYLWVLVSAYIIFTSFSDISTRMKRLYSDERSRTLTSLVYRQLDKCWPYPFIVIICWIPSAVNDIICASNPSLKLPGMTFLNYFSTCLPILIGFFTSITFIRYNYGMLSTEWGHILSFFKWTATGRKIAVIDTDLFGDGIGNFFSKMLRLSRPRADDAEYVMDNATNIGPYLPEESDVEGGGDGIGAAAASTTTGAAGGGVGGVCGVGGTRKGMLRRKKRDEDGSDDGGVSVNSAAYSCDYSQSVSVNVGGGGGGGCFGGLGSDDLPASSTSLLGLSLGLSLLGTTDDDAPLNICGVCYKVREPSPHEPRVSIAKMCLCSSATKSSKSTVTGSNKIPRSNSGLNLGTGMGETGERRLMRDRDRGGGGGGVGVGRMRESRTVLSSASELHDPSLSAASSVVPGLDFTSTPTRIPRKPSSSNFLAAVGVVGIAVSGSTGGGSSAGTGVGGGGSGGGVTRTLSQRNLMLGHRSRRYSSHNASIHDSTCIDDTTILSVDPTNSVMNTSRSTNRINLSGRGNLDAGYSARNALD